MLCVCMCIYYLWLGLHSKSKNNIKKIHCNSLFHFSDFIRIISPTKFILLKKKCL